MEKAREGQLAPVLALRTSVRAPSIDVPLVRAAVRARVVDHRLAGKAAVAGG